MISREYRVYCKKSVVISQCYYYCAHHGNNNRLVMYTPDILDEPDMVAYLLTEDNGVGL